jgi:hypothetical protein
MSIFATLVRRVSKGAQKEPRRAKIGRRTDVLDRALHVDVPGRIHRRAQRGTRHDPDDLRQWPLITYVSHVGIAMARAKQAAGEEDVLVHGARTAQLALAAGVLDELQIHLIPVLLREGRRLFEHLGLTTSSSSRPGSSMATAPRISATASAGEAYGDQRHGCTFPCAWLPAWRALPSTEACVRCEQSGRWR